MCVTGARGLGRGHRPHRELDDPHDPLPSRFFSCTRSGDFFHLGSRVRLDWGVTMFTRNKGEPATERQQEFLLMLLAKAEALFDGPVMVGNWHLTKRRIKKLTKEEASVVITQLKPLVWDS